MNMGLAHLSFSSLWDCSINPGLIYEPLDILALCLSVTVKVKQAEALGLSQTNTLMIFIYVQVYSSKTPVFPVCIQ